MVDVVSKDNLKEHVLTKLDDGKLDPNEVAFLKKQKEGLKDLDTVTVNMLRGDILATNKKSLKGPKASTFLNWGVANFDKIYRKLFPSWAKMDQDNYFINKLKSKGLVEQQWILINMLLVQSIGGGQSYSYKVGQKAYKINFSPSWFLTAGQGNYMSITTIRMLHKFQSTNAQGESIKSKADCIIGPKTIQQLFDSANIDFGNLTGTGSLNVEEEYKSGYNSEEYDESTANEKLGKIVNIRNTSEPKNPVHYAEQLIHLYKGAKNKNVIVESIKGLYVNLDEYISTIQNPMDKIRVKKSVRGIFSKISEFRDTEDENQLNEKIRPQWKLNQLKTVIETADMYVKYLEKQLPDIKKNLHRPAIKKMYEIISNLKKKYNSNESLLNIDFILKDGTSLIRDIFLFPNDIRRIIYPTSQASFNDTPGIGKILDIFTSSKEEDRNNDNLKNMKTNILSYLRSVDGDIGGSRESGDIIMDDVGDEISELDLGGHYSELNNKLFDLDEFLKDKGNENGEHTKMDQLLSITTGHNVLSFMDMKNIAQKNGIMDGLEKRYKDGKGAVVSFLKKTFKINDKYANKIWESFNKEYEKIKTGNELIKKETKKRLKKQYGDEQISLQTDIKFLNSQMESIKGSRGENDPKYLEYKTKKEELENRIGRYDDLLIGNVVETTDDTGATVNVSLDIMAESAYEAANELAFALSAEKLIGLAILETHEDQVDEIQKKVKEGGNNILSDRKKLSMIGDIEGIGKGLSDKTVNTIIDVTKEVIIEVAICAVSMGVGNVVSAGVRGLYRAGKYAIKAYKASRKVSQFSKMANGLQKTLRGGKKLGVIKNTIKIGNKTKSFVYKGTKKLANMISEGTGFHIASTTLNNAISDNPLMAGLALDNAQNIKGYVQSIAFLGVLKEVMSINGQLIKGLNSGKGVNKGFTSELTPQKLKIVQNIKIPVTGAKPMKFKLKDLAGNFGKYTGSVATEMGGLMLTEQIISLSFGEGVKEVTMKEMTNMLGMVLGLRALGKANPFNAINKKLDNYIVSEVKRNPKGIITDFKINEIPYSEIKNMKTQMGRSKIKVKQYSENVSEGINSQRVKLEQLKQAKIKLDKKYGELFDAYNKSKDAQYRIELNKRLNETSWYKNLATKDIKVLENLIKTELSLLKGIENSPNSHYKELLGSEYNTLRQKEITIENKLETVEKDYKLNEVDGKTRELLQELHDIAIKLKNLENLAVTNRFLAVGKNFVYTSSTGKNILKVKVLDNRFVNGKIEYQIVEYAKDGVTLTKRKRRMNETSLINMNKFAKARNYTKAELEQMSKNNIELEIIKLEKQKNELVDKMKNENLDAATSGKKVDTGPNSTYMKLQKIKVQLEVYKNVGFGVVKLQSELVELRSQKTELLGKLKNENFDAANAGRVVDGGKVLAELAKIRFKIKIKESALTIINKNVKNSKFPVSEVAVGPLLLNPVINTKFIKTKTKNISKFSRYEQSALKGLKGLTNKNITLPEQIKKRQETTPEYDVTGKPTGAYKIAIENMQKFLKDGKFYKKGEVSTADGVLGQHTQNALNRWKTETLHINSKKRETVKPEKLTEIIKKEVSEPIQKNRTWLQNKTKKLKELYIGIQMNRNVSKTKLQSIEYKVKDVIREQAKLENPVDLMKSIDKTADLIASDIVGGINGSARLRVIEVGARVGEFIKKISTRPFVESGRGLKKLGNSLSKIKKTIIEKAGAGSKKLVLQIDVMINKVKLALTKNKQKLISSARVGTILKIQGQHKAGYEKIYLKKLADGKWETIKSSNESLINKINKISFEPGSNRPQIGELTLTGDRRVNSVFLKPKPSQKVMETKTIDELIVNKNVDKVQKELVEQYTEAKDLSKRNEILEKIKTSNTEKPQLAKNIARKTKELYKKEVDAGLLEIKSENKFIKTLKKKFDGKTITSKNGKEISFSEIELAIESRNMNAIHDKLNIDGLKHIKLGIHKEILSSITTRTELISYVGNSPKFFGGTNGSNAIIAKLGKVNKTADNIFESHKGHMSKEGLELFTSRLTEVIKIEKATVLSDLSGTFSSADLIRHKDYLIAKGMKGGVYKTLLINKQALENLGGNQPLESSNIAKLQSVLDKLAA